jgi:cytoskeletal protein CcmA (bactofilin family)
MSWKKPDAYNPPPPAPLEPPPQPTAPRSQPSTNKERALIGPSIEIKGNLSGGEDLQVEGRVEGKIELAQYSITIGTKGRIKADIKGRNIIVMGEVEGNIYGSEQIVLRQSSKVTGNLVAPRVSLEDGANFKGSIDMTSKPAAEEAKPLHVDSPAVKPPSKPALGQDKSGDKV